MPTLSISTNLCRDKIPQEIVPELSEICAKHFQVPAGGVSIEVRSDCQLSFGGNFDPVALLRLESVGRLRPKVNAALGKEIEDYLVAKLGIPGNRILTQFLRREAMFTFINGSLVNADAEYD